VLLNPHLHRWGLSNRLKKYYYLRVDGAYYSKEINNKAKANGIKIVPTNLVGGGKNSNGDKFEIDEKEHLVKKYPSYHKPIPLSLKKDSIEHILIRNTARIDPSIKIVQS
jgi:hypothetical protein